MNRRQLPFSFLDYSHSDLTDPEHDLLSYFTQIRDENIQPIFDNLYSGRGPKGFGLNLFLAQILKIKENFLSDRALESKLLSNSIYRFCCGFDRKQDVPHFSSFSKMRKRLGAQGYIDIHTKFVNQAHEIGFIDSTIPGLPRHRKTGVVLIADSTFLYAHCSKSALRKLNSDFVRDEKGRLVFKDSSARIGRPHHTYKFPLGHRAQTLHTVNGVPLVSLVVEANRGDEEFIFDLLEGLSIRHPQINFAYIILDKGYDEAPIHQRIYYDYGIIPVIIRKNNIRYPRGFLQNGTPLCEFGIGLIRRGTDYHRERTKYICNQQCKKKTKPQKELFTCPYVTSTNSNGLVIYTYFNKNMRLYGPATPNSRIYQKLKPLRIGIERDYALLKANRYRMQATLNYEGFESVLQHVILFDIVLVQDKIFEHLNKNKTKKP